MKISNELKVGGLIVGTGILAAGFAWFLGVQNPFGKSFTFYLTYNFAGGVEVGSPVRLSGIKVGKVEKIEFFKPTNAKPVALSEPGSAESGDELDLTPVRLQISLSKEAAIGVKKDSRFYINMAGIIGERYVEITPGTKRAERVAANDVMAGVDPPRIDQLLSQSFDLAGKISEIVEKNKGDIGRSIELLYKLSGNLNKTLQWVDKSAVFKTDIGLLINNLIDITRDVKIITDKAHTPEGEKTLKLLYDLLWRLEPLDSKAIRDFAQKEGIKARVGFF